MRNIIMLSISWVQKNFDVYCEQIDNLNEAIPQNRAALTIMMIDLFCFIHHNRQTLNPRLNNQTAISLFGGHFFRKTVFKISFTTRNCQLDATVCVHPTHILTYSDAMSKAFIYLQNLMVCDCILATWNLLFNPRTLSSVFTIQIRRKCSYPSCVLACIIYGTSIRSRIIRIQIIESPL